MQEIKSMTGKRQGEVEHNPNILKESILVPLNGFLMSHSFKTQKSAQVY